MQVVYLGFAGAAPLEAEAGVQLIRLARFSQRIVGCHLVIEATCDCAGRSLYEARLDLLTRDSERAVVSRGSDADPARALRAAFDSAERTLERDIRWLTSGQAQS